jgi:LacI family transcriptional regulator
MHSVEISRKEVDVTHSTTIHDVARRAGVGVGTVSRVLNDSPQVNPETRERVLQAIKELDYSPHFAARHMRTSNSRMIGLISDEIASTPFAVDIISGVQDYAWTQGRLLFIANTNGNLEIEKAVIRDMLRRRVEGVIYATMRHQEITLSDKLHKVPTVLLNCFAADYSLPSVVPNEVFGAWSAITTLIQHGHRRIGFINLSCNLPAVKRLEGYKQAMVENGLPYSSELVLEGEGNALSGYEHALTLMRLPESPTAIFCGNDRTAMGAYDALKEQGLRIPDDVSIIGFDNQEVIAAYLRPALTTIALPFYEMGQWAAEYLLSHASDADASPENPVQEKLLCPYIERQSVRMLG